MRFVMSQKSFCNAEYVWSWLLSKKFKYNKIASEARMYDCSAYIIPQGCPEAKNMDLVLGMRFEERT